MAMIGVEGGMIMPMVEEATVMPALCVAAACLIAAFALMFTRR